MLITQNLNNAVTDTHQTVQCSDEAVPHCGGAGVLQQEGEHFQGEASSTEERAG